MKLISAVLLALLLLNSFFYVLYCNISIWQRQAEVKDQITNQRFGSAVTVVKIPSASIGKDLATKDEIWYNKNLYDVVKRQVVHDTVYIYMLTDEEEENLVDKIDAYISAGDTQTSDGNCAVHAEKNLLKVIPQPYICNPLPSIFCMAKSSSSHYEQQYYKYFIAPEIITPPPRGKHQA